MNTYTETYLSVKVTATGNTARTMRSWTPAARQEYLRDQIVMFLNGRCPDFCVECVDLEAVELQRCVTQSDLSGGRACNPEPRGTAEEKTPAPVTAPQASEWPKWGRGRCEIYRFESEDSGAYYAEGGNKGRCEFQRTWTARVIQHGKGEITEAEALSWLRANGHAKVADEIDGEGRFEPVGTVPVVGDRIGWLAASCHP